MPTRRELLWGMAGAAGAVAAGAFIRGFDDPRDAIKPVTHGPYGHGAEPPTSLGPQALDAVTIPPPMTSGPVERTLTITQRPMEVAQGRVMDAWTFDGSIPGPILRVTEGERLTLRVKNLTSDPHNLHTHGAHSPSVDGWEPIPPGGERVYGIEPRPFGLYPYHCDLVPEVQHLGRGLHGAMIVDPRGGRPVAQERVLVLGGFDVDADGRSDLFGWNGVAGFFARHPLKVRRGELVRLHVVNLVGDEPVATFHVHSNTFDVFRSGTRLVADEHSDVVALTVGERAMLEMRFAETGRVMFHPHQARMAENGAMGWITVV